MTDKEQGNGALGRNITIGAISGVAGIAIKAASDAGDLGHFVDSVMDKTEAGVAVLGAAGLAAIMTQMKLAGVTIGPAQRAKSALNVMIAGTAAMAMYAALRTDIMYGAIEKVYTQIFG